MTLEEITEVKAYIQRQFEFEVSQLQSLQATGETFRVIGNLFDYAIESAYNVYNYPVLGWITSKLTMDYKTVMIQLTPKAGLENYQIAEAWDFIDNHYVAVY